MPLEQLFVEALVLQSVIERFHERIPRRLSGRDIVSLLSSFSSVRSRWVFDTVIAPNQAISV